MPTRQPNIILCTVDQLRPFETACCEHPVVRTPSMRRMMDQGPWFEVACSNSPLCVPARSALITGQYARTCTGTMGNHVGFPPSRQRVRCADPTLPEVLRAAGYRTGLVGKWHVHPAPDLVGFDEAIFPHNLHRHFGQTFYRCDGWRETIPGFSLDFEFEQVQHFIRTHRDRPFFLQYNLSPPHSPLCDAPSRYANRYAREAVQLRDNVVRDGVMADDKEVFRRYMWDYLGMLPENLEGDEASMTDNYDQRIRERPLHGLRRVYRDLHHLVASDPRMGAQLTRALPYLDDARVQATDLVELYRLYYGMVDCVDDYLGALLDWVDDTGLTQDTLILFTSDHGDQLGSHHRWQKACLYEESIRIPLLLRYPGTLPPGCLREQLASQIDIMPTLLTLAGLAVPETVQGQDLAPVLRGETATTGRNAVFVEAWQQQAIGVRTPTHLCGAPLGEGPEQTASPRMDQAMLFDLTADPFQQHNLAAVAPERASLERQLRAWHTATPWLCP